MLRPGKLFDNFWLKLLSLALAIMIWFTIYLAVQQEQRSILPPAPVSVPENSTNAPVQKN